MRFRRRHHLGWLRGSGTIAVMWLMLLVSAAVLGPWLPLERGQNLDQIRQGPSWAHPLGTDGRGVSMVVGIIDGARTSLVVAFAGAAIGVLVGGLLGVLIGYRRAWLDRAGVVGLDVLSAFPAFVAAVTATLIFQQSIRTISLILGVLTIPVFARLARATTLPIADREFVLAARMLGATHRRVVFRDLLPNVAVPVLSYALIAGGLIIAIEGALSYIGAGVPEGVQSWGKLIAAGQERVQDAPHLVLVPAMAILLTVLALNTVAERWNERWLFGGRPPKPVTAAKPRPQGVRVSFDDQLPRPRSGLVVEDLHTWLETPFGQVRAVTGVNLALRPGELTALVGESGSGKTMLARSLLGLVSAPLTPDLPGRIIWDGVDLRTIDEPSMDGVRGRRIAMVFQDPMTSLDPVQRVGRQLTEPMRVHFGLTKQEARERAQELLRSVGVPDPPRRMRAYPHELSGGLRQRVAIAIALSCDPDILIADEPTSALDVTVQAQLLDLLDDLRRDRRLAVLLITHDLAIVAGRADRVAVMYGGRIVEEGPTAEVIGAPRMPYTRALLDAGPHMHQPPHSRLSAIPGLPPVLLGEPAGCAFAPRCANVGARCREDRPVLDDIAAGEAQHRVACWHPLVPAPYIVGIAQDP